MDLDEYFEINIFTKFLHKIYDIFGLTSPLGSSSSYKFSSDYSEIEYSPEQIESYPLGGWWKMTQDFQTCFKAACDQYKKDYNLSYDDGFAYLHYIYRGRYDGNVWPNVEDLAGAGITTLGDGSDNTAGDPAKRNDGATVPQATNTSTEPQMISLESISYVNTSRVTIKVQFRVPPLVYETCLVKYDSSHGYKTDVSSSGITNVSPVLDGLNKGTTTKQDLIIFKRDGVIYALCNGATFKYGDKSFVLPDFRDKFLRETTRTDMGYKRSFNFTTLAKDGDFKAGKGFKPTVDGSGTRFVSVRSTNEIDIRSPHVPMKFWMVVGYY